METLPRAASPPFPSCGSLPTVSSALLSLAFPRTPFSRRFFTRGWWGGTRTQTPDTGKCETKMVGSAFLRSSPPFQPCQPNQFSNWGGQVPLGPDGRFFCTNRFSGVLGGCITGKGGPFHNTIVMLMLQGEQEPQAKVRQSRSGFRNLQVFAFLLARAPGDNNYTCLFKGLAFFSIRK